jgi:hypothetical protein
MPKYPSLVISPQVTHAASLEIVAWLTLQLSASSLSVSPCAAAAVLPFAGAGQSVCGQFS